jgi:hypothetical protein
LDTELRAAAEEERVERAKRSREDSDSEMVKEVLGTSTSDDPDSSKELVVDLGIYETEPPAPAPEPVLASSAKEKAGFMGAVKSAFSRGGRGHEHDFVAAPGGLGITRSICRECGFVSISAND